MPTDKLFSNNYFAYSQLPTSYEQLAVSARFGVMYKSKTSGQLRS